MTAAAYEIRVGDNINSRKCHRMWRGELLTGDYSTPGVKHTNRVVYSLGNGMIQLAAVQPFSGKIVDVSAPMPAAWITQAGRSPYMSSFMQYWKPRGGEHQKSFLGGIDSNRRYGKIHSDAADTASGLENGDSEND
jgi:hypothetical protein